MKISTKGRYALRLMLDIAENSNGEYVRLKDVAERQEISEKYLEQICGLLTRAGLVKGVRGAQGGYKLAKGPSGITIGDILRVTEGSLAPVACLDDEINNCPRSGKCASLNFWKSLYKTIEDFVDCKTLQDLIDENGGDYLNFTI